jgi:outer membrane lipoprotein SlyB
MYKKIVLGLIAVAAFMPLPFVASQAQAQNYTRNAMPRIDGFDVEAVRRPTAGNELAFTLYGSPGGSAAVQIAGATGGLALTETEAGVYEGSYTIRQRDRITVNSTATANLRLGNQVASTVLDEPLIGTPSGRRSSRAAAAAGAPTIDYFDVERPQNLAPGEELTFIMSGTRDGKASVKIAGVKGKIVLDETRPGIYEGSHTIKRRDRIEANSVVTGQLRIGERETNSVLGQSLLAGPGYQSRPRQAARSCVNCGAVEAINVIEVKGDGTYLGKIAGGLAGALLGNQVGHGTGKTVATVAGAAGGAYVGNEVEKRVKTTKHYEVIVRLENGGTQTITYTEQPPFAVGARVKVENGALTVVQQ